MKLIKDGKNYGAELSDTLDLEIGDAKEPVVFYPQVKLKAWKNEANFSVRLSVPEAGSDATAPVNGKSDIVTWNGDKRTVFLYYKEKSAEHPEGAFEFDIFLPEKPADNVFTFTLEHKNVAVYYQPPLTELVGTEGIVTATETEGFNKNGKLVARRPENVVGSYAIYHAAMPGNVKGGKKYRCGKICHIYRPQAVDAAGKKTWCVLTVDLAAKKLKVKIPQNWLDKAVFPVAVDPTFGNTTIQATEVYFNAAGSIGHVGSGFLFSPTSGYNRITKFTAYGRGGSIDMAAYTITGGLPDVRVEAAVQIDLPVANNWQDSGAVSQTLINGNTYGCAEGNAVAAYLFFDTGTGNQRSSCATNLPATWTSTGVSAALYSWYATYETVTDMIL